MTGPRYHLALRELHAAAGATFRDVSGWSLPAHYGDAGLEYEALRETAGVADRSHFSRFIVTGTDAHEVLAAAFAGHVNELEEGRAMRSVALRDGVIDDLVLIARTGGISYIVIGQPGQRMATFERLSRAMGPDYDARIEDRTESTCLVSLAGTRTAETAAATFGDALQARVRAMQVAAFEFHGFRSMAIRTSDTGDDGFELMLSPAVAQHLLESLREAGVGLVGHDAMEVARVEACIPAFEPDLSPGLTPAEADLDVLLDIPGGADERILAALVIDGDQPVATGSLISGESGITGEVRSCVYSPRLRATIGLAILDAARAVPGTHLEVAGRRCGVVAKPLYRRREQP